MLPPLAGLAGHIFIQHVLSDVKILIAAPPQAEQHSIPGIFKPESETFGLLVTVQVPAPLHVFLAPPFYGIWTIVRVVQHGLPLDDHLGPVRRRRPCFKPHDTQTMIAVQTATQNSKANQRISRIMISLRSRTL